MKKPVFHQFIQVQRGHKKSLIIDFLKNKHFHIENYYIDEFLEKGRSANAELLESLKKNDLIIEVEQDVWVPDQIPPKDDISLGIIEVEEGADYKRIEDVFSVYEIYEVWLYVDELRDKKDKIIDSVRTIIKRKDLDLCKNLSTINKEEKFSVFSEKCIVVSFVKTTLDAI